MFINSPALHTAVSASLPLTEHPLLPLTTHTLKTTIHPISCAPVQGCLQGGQGLAGHLRSTHSTTRRRQQHQGAGTSGRVLKEQQVCLCVSWSGVQLLVFTCLLTGHASRT